MKDKTKILAFTGSLREKSFNKRILRTAIKGAERSGAQVTLIDLLEYPMPIYNPDDESKNGFPENALRFQELLTQHDALLIASPEYNGSLPAALKNAIDWASRQSGQINRDDVFQGKPAAIMSAGPGTFGGVRSLLHLRGVLMSVGAEVLSQEFAVPHVADKFAGDDDEITDQKTKMNLENLGVRLAEMLKKTGVKRRAEGN